MRKRTSPIWTISKDKLERIVKNSDSLAKVLKQINLDPYGSGSRYRSLKERLKIDSIDYSHIRLGSFSNSGRNFDSKAISLKEIMVENSTYSRNHLKRRLLENNILENCCAICGQEPTWKNIKLVMVLDHINGVRNANRLENLRLLCPNCNSQQKTFAGKCNKRPLPVCKNCGKEVSRRSKTKLCKNCYVNRRIT